MTRFLVIFLLPGSLYAQYFFTGKVLDAETGQPLTGATIAASNNEGTVSSEDGEFSFRLGAATRFEISYIGYQARYLELSSKRDIYQDILLVPSGNLEEVVVQAVRANSSSPVTQTTLNRAEIEGVFVGQDPVFALQSKTPSVIAYSESGSGFVNYSLMRLRGIDQTRINITLDGAPLNDMIDQGVFFSNFNDFGNSIESVQMQRGVGASTNGTASYAGSISFESTRLNDPDPSAQVKLVGGSFGTFQGSAEVKTGLLKNDMAFYSRYTKTLSDGYKYHSGTNSDSYFLSGGYFGKRDLVKVTSFVGQTRNELAYLPVFLGDIQNDPRTNYLDENDEDDFGQQFVQLQHTHWFRNAWSITSSVYYGGAGGDFPYGFRDDNNTLTQINYWLKNDHLGVTSYLHYQGRGKLRASGGVHAYTFRRRNEERIVPDNANPYYHDSSQKDEISLFAKLDYDLGNLTIYGDLQLRMVSLGLTPDFDFLADQGQDVNSINLPDRNWAFINPKIGLNYRLSKSWSLYSTFGRSGREPTRVDILGSTTINIYNISNVADQNSVMPEFVNDLELGARFDGTNFKTQANFFYMNFSNEIAPIGEFITEGFVQLRENIASSFRSGIEWEWAWKPAHPLSVDGNITFMKSEINEFSPGGSDEVFTQVKPILSPEWMLNGNVSYRIKKVAEVSLKGRYVSDSFLELTNREALIMPSFFVADLHLSLWFLGGQSITFQVNNLFDQQYFTNGAPVDVDYDGIMDGPGYLVQAPRNFLAVMRLNF